MNGCSEIPAMAHGLRSAAAAIKKPNSASEKPVRPRVLITSTTQWVLGARVAIALSDAGFKVSAVCSDRDQTLRKTSVVREIFPYSYFRPLQALSSAIDASGPELIVPCDDRAVHHLHELYTSTRNEAIRNLIERSLGSPENYSTVSDRYGLLEIARDEGSCVPDTLPINSRDDLAGWGRTHPFPWVLKADYTCAGAGVRIVRNFDEAEQSLLELQGLFKGYHALKRWAIGGDPFWLRSWWNNVTPGIVVQSFLPGAPANCAVVCWEGKILAGIAVEVLMTEGPTKPAIAVRLVKNSEMMLAAQRIAGRLRLSGFLGLDFVIDERTGTPYLLEMNPRCAPPCHLQLGPGHDLAGALFAQVSGQKMREIPAITDKEIVAYFPTALRSNSALLENSFHDIPESEATLVAEILQAQNRALLPRLARYVRTKISAVRFTGPAQEREKASCGPWFAR